MSSALLFLLSVGTVFSSPQTVVFDDSSRLVNYQGTQKVNGNVTLAESANGTTSFVVSLQGFDPNAQGSLFLHTGLSCSPTNMGGAFFVPFDRPNPYAGASSFSADAEGKVSAQFDVDIGYPLNSLRGRALVVHDADNNDISCSLTQSVSPVQVSLARSPAYEGTNNVTGFLSLASPSTNTITVTYVLKGLPLSTVSGRVYAIQGTSCQETSSYFWRPETAPNPWINSTLYFRANSAGDAEGSFDIEPGVTMDELAGHPLVVALDDGTVAACGIFPVPVVVPAREGNWVIGVLCSTLASFGTVVGMLLQKWSHMQESKKATASLNNSEGAEVAKTHVMCRPLWWLSLFFMILVPAPLDIAAFAFASQSLLAPLSGITLLLNAVFAPLVLKEKVTRQDLVASVLIAVGAAITTVFGAHTQTQYTVPTLYILFARPEWIFFQVLANVGVVTLWLAVRLALAERTRFPSLRLLLKNNLAYLLAVLVALSGAQQMVFTKTVSELILESFEGNMQFTYLLTYVLIGLAIWMAVFQIGYLNKGLELFDAVYFLPLYNAALIVLCIVVGGVYFDEVAHVTWLQIALFVLGVLICVGGVFLLKKRPAAIDGAKAALIASDELGEELVVTGSYEKPEEI